MEDTVSGCTAAPSRARVAAKGTVVASSSRRGLRVVDRAAVAIGLVVLLLLVSAVSPAAANAEAAINGAQQSRVPWPFYSTVDQTLGYLRSAAKTHSHVLQLSDELDLESGTTLPMVTVTDFATGKEGKQVIMLVFAEHAREIITSEISLWLIRFLIGDAEEFMQWPATQEMQRSNAERKVGEDGGRIEHWRSHLLRNIVFKMLPIVNLEGRRKVEAGDFCLRTKLNNVDLNRNYPVGFQRKAPRSMDYGGGAPFSEPETRIIRAQVSGEGPRQEGKPRAFVSVHSGEWALYIPWDSKMTRGEDLPDDAEALLARMNIHCKCMSGPAGKVAGYLAFGSGMDYMYSVARVPYPLTVEVYGPNGLGTLAAGGHPRRMRRSLLQYGLQSRLIRAGSSPNLRCLKEFNPDTEPLYQDTVAKWVGSFLNMAVFLAPFNISAESSSEAGASSNRTKSTGKAASEAAAAVYGSARGSLAGASGASASALQQHQQSLEGSLSGSSNSNDGVKQRDNNKPQVAAFVLQPPGQASFASSSIGVAGGARREGERVPDHEPQPPPPRNSSKLQVAWARGRKSLSGWRSRGGVLLSPVAQLLVYAALVGIAMSCLAVIARNRRASGHSKARTM